MDRSASGSLTLKAEFDWAEIDQSRSRIDAAKSVKITTGHSKPFAA